MRPLRPLAALMVLAALAPVSGGQPPAKPPEPGALAGNAVKVAEFAAVEARRYDIRPAGGRNPLELVAEPVLRYSSATGGEVHGEVYLWDRDGCPAAAIAAYQLFFRDQLNVELVSLSEAPLSAKRNDRVRWTPEAGLKFMPLPDGPDPASTPAARQLQARTLARRFTGFMSDRGNPDKLSELRLLPKPLRQYAATDRSGREGAVFSSVLGTDPAVLLLVESRPRNGGREWAWAVARMDYRRLHLKLGDKVVWDVPQVAPPWEKVRGPEGEYVILQWATAEEAAKD